MKRGVGGLLRAKRFERLQASDSFRTAMLLRTHGELHFTAPVGSCLSTGFLSKCSALPERKRGLSSRHHRCQSDPITLIELSIFAIVPIDPCPTKPRGNETVSFVSTSTIVGDRWGLSDRRIATIRSLLDSRSASALSSALLCDRRIHLRLSV